VKVEDDGAGFLGVLDAAHEFLIVEFQLHADLPGREFVRDGFAKGRDFLEGALSNRSVK